MSAGGGLARVSVHGSTEAVVSDSYYMHVKWVEHEIETEIEENDKDVWPSTVSHP